MLHPLFCLTLLPCHTFTHPAPFFNSGGRVLGAGPDTAPCFLPRAVTLPHFYPRACFVYCFSLFRRLNSGSWA